MNFFNKVKTIAKIIINLLWLIVSITLWLFGLVIFVQYIQGGKALLGWLIWCLICTPETVVAGVRALSIQRYTEYMSKFSGQYGKVIIAHLLIGIFIGGLYSFVTFSSIILVICDHINSLKE